MLNKKVELYSLRSDDQGDFIGACSDGEYVSKDEYEALRKTAFALYEELRKINTIPAVKDKYGERIAATLAAATA